MAGAVNLYQIIWKEEQKPNLYDFAIAFLNESLTPFFENDVIARVVPRESSDKVGVGSWQLRQKICSGVPMKQEFTEEVMNWDYEVLSLSRKDTEQDMLWRLDQWHPGSRATLNKIFDKLGKQIPGRVRDPIYQNHFIAKTSIYQDYCSELLIPAMKIMSEDEEISALCMEDSHYFKLKPPYTEFARRCEQFFGKPNYCPMHAFLCERMFSIWLTNKPIAVRYL